MPKSTTSATRSIRSDSLESMLKQMKDVGAHNDNSPSVKARLRVENSKDYGDSDSSNSSSDINAYNELIKKCIRSGALELVKKILGIIDESKLSEEVKGLLATEGYGTPVTPEAASVVAHASSEDTVKISGDCFPEGE